MAITLIKKRGGSIADFDRSRIETAITKAYSAAGVVIDELSLGTLVDAVVQQLGRYL